MKKKKSLNRNLIEWGIIILLPVTLYLTGLHTTVLGAIQRLVVSTGVRNAETDFADNNLGRADYNFTLQSFNGKTINAEAFKGKTIFLNLWASWCPPCRAEMPNIEDLYKNIKDKNVEFIFISFDEDPKKAEEFIKDYEFSEHAYILKSGFPSVYSSGTIPTTFIISPDGIIKLKEAGMANYDTEAFQTEILSLQPPKNTP